MRSLSTAFWSVVLVGSAVAIGAGFAGGRSIGNAAALPQPHVFLPPPLPIVERSLTRSLVGVHSLEASEDDVDRYGDPDNGVAARPEGWLPGSYDARHDRARIAIVVVDASRSGRALAAFLATPLPLTVVVAPNDPDAENTFTAASDAGKPVLVDSAGTDVARLRAYEQRGAIGVFGSAQSDRADRLVHALGSHHVAVDACVGEDDVLFRRARKAGVPAVTRDVLADGRDDPSYVDFMLRDALQIAHRTGIAVIAVHARPQTFVALQRFAERAERDGADLVTISALTGV